MKCSQSCFLHSLILIDRIQEINEGFRVTRKNIFRLYAASLMVSAKLLEDFYYKNSYYSIVFGISIRDVNLLETHLLGLLGYNAHVPSELFHQYEKQFKEFLELSQPPKASDSTEKKKCKNMKKNPSKESLSDSVNTELVTDNVLP